MSLFSRDVGRDIWVLGTLWLLASCAPPMTSGGTAKITLSVVDDEAPASTVIAGSALGSGTASLSSLGSGLRLMGDASSLGVDTSAIDLATPFDPSIDPVKDVDVLQRYCYALNITADDLMISKESNSSCTLATKPPGVGRIAGLFDYDDLANGVEVHVPAGLGRRFDLVALRKEKVLDGKKGARCKDVKFEVRVVDASTASGATNASVSASGGGNTRFFVDGQMVPDALDKAWSDRLMAMSQPTNLVIGDNAVTMVKQGGAYGTLYGCPDATPNLDFVLGGQVISKSTSVATAPYVNALPAITIPANAGLHLFRYDTLAEMRVPSQAAAFNYAMPIGNANLTDGVHLIQYRRLDAAGLPVSLRNGQVFNLSTARPDISALTLNIKVNAGKDSERIYALNSHPKSLEQAPLFSLSGLTTATLSQISKIVLSSPADANFFIEFSPADLANATYKGRALTVPSASLSATYQLTAIAYSKSGVASDPRALDQYVLFRCPSADTEGGLFIGVSGKAGDTTVDFDDFCVAKYEMKAKLDTYGFVAPVSRLTAVSWQGSTGNYVNVSPSPTPTPTVISALDGAPWTYITRTEAEGKCSGLGGAGTSTYSLISNTQWQTIAAIIANDASNWFGSVGTGILPSGNADRTKVAAAYTPPFPFPFRLPASNTDTNTCSGLSGVNCDGTDWKYRRVLKVGASVIWDFAGNVGEWVKYTLPATPTPTMPTYGTQLSYLNLGSYSWIKDAFAPPSFILTSTSVGTFLNSNTTAKDGVVRGGDNNGSPAAGVYAAKINVDPGTFDANTGFRCVYKP